ncbi:MAG: thiamine phosphate synthase [Sphingobium sp.]|nr:thiamine phosphate synthase [Sphingobium sp.]
MRKCAKPLPSLWLMTDERLGDEALLAAVARLPKGSGVVFRHYRTERTERRALFEKVRAIALRRRLVLLVAGEWPGGPMRRIAGRHTPGWMRGRRARGGAEKNKRAALLSMPVHDARDMVMARRAGADMVFVSPVFPTRSHPGGEALGAIGFGRLVRGADMKVMALGGMSVQRFRRLKGLGADGWAGIDALR